MDLLSVPVLADAVMPGKPSPLSVSYFGPGVGVGSTETTLLIGNTRSVADGLNWLYGESETGDVGEAAGCVSCTLDLHGVRSDSAPKDWRCRECNSEDERW